MDADTRYLRRGALTLGAVAIGGFATDYAFNLGLTRFLSPHGYGDVKVAFAFAHFFGLAVLLGGDRAAPMVLAPCLERRQSRRVWEYLRFYLGNAMLLSLAVVAVTWTLSYLHLGSTDPMDHHPMALIVLVLPLNAFAAMVSRTLQSARRPAQAALPWRIGLPVLELLLFAAVVGVRGTLSVEQAVALAIVAAATVTLGQWLWVRHLGLVEIAREPGFRQGHRWLRSSLPMMGSILVALALNQSDVYFLEALGEEAEVGHYAAAATAAHLLLLVQTTVIGLVAPLARTAIEGGDESSAATRRRAERLMLGLTLPIAAILAAASGPILTLFGPGYGAARPVLALLALGGFAWAAAAVPGLWLQYHGSPGAVLAISAATLAADSALNLLLIPRYGMTGAAAGTAATLTAAAAATLIVRRRTAGS